MALKIKKKNRIIKAYLPELLKVFIANSQKSLKIQQNKNRHLFRHPAFRAGWQDKTLKANFGKIT